MLVVGDVVIDVVARYDEPLSPGTDTAARIRILPGGAGANVACWAARTGRDDVRLLARVGAGEASWHEAALRRAGVRPLLVRDDGAPTATVVALVDGRAGAERTFLTDSGAVVRLSPADWSPRLLDGVAHLHLSGYLFFAPTSRRTARLAMAAAREREVPVSVDPASAGFVSRLGADRFLTAVAGADVLFPNADEAVLLAGLSGPEEAAAALSRRHGLVVATLGAAGAVVARAGGVVARVSAPGVRPVDTTGAGDAFTGGFLAARLAGASAAEAAEAGCRAGGAAVTAVGGRPAPPGPVTVPVPRP
ncbi:MULTISPECIES: carbohydrate kinase family protein [Streptomyces]|uniref:Sugar kinase n=2 Tax=Streptomyces TaxID=1883 RepID=A0A100Y0J4_9ACTN|nr:MULTISPECIES: PfkB family carbohydrate kinase [Streptomyces]KUH35439.1 sugar kinase [Streptomyces kanasensis]UUS34729.1 PfkB family carbohydrate kinase [Streptomyces changanensis]